MDQTCMVKELLDEVDQLNSTKYVNKVANGIQVDFLSKWFSNFS